MLAAVLLALVASASPPAAPGEGLHDPARCALDYLQAVRLAGPLGPVLTARRDLRQRYRAVRALIAPRTLVEIDQLDVLGQDHPLASWRAAEHGLVLESSSLLGIRRAPLGAAVVTVRERWRRDRARALQLTLSEYLVARVGGAWRIVARRIGEPLQDEEIAERYEGWFDQAR